MRPISPRVRKQIDSDPFYNQCCICGSKQVILHHVWIYSGKQIDEAWAIVPVCEEHHDNCHTKKDLDIVNKIKYISITRATNLNKYPKKNWTQEKERLK